MHCACSRLDRCFLSGHNKQQLRQYLRVIAGRRLRSGDPRYLQPDQLKACLNACPAASRFVPSSLSHYIHLQTICQRNRFSSLPSIRYFVCCCAQQAASVSLIVRVSSSCFLSRRSCRLWKTKIEVLLRPKQGRRAQCFRSVVHQLTKLVSALPVLISYLCLCLLGHSKAGSFS